MPQALIKINGVAGSNTDLPINTIVQLDNQNIGGELTYTWAILDQPPGPNDNLSSSTVQNPTFTPKKEGTYLIRLIVNETLPSEQQDKAVGAVRQIKTRERIIAAGETTEADLIDGWATSNNSYLRRMDDFLSDAHVIIGANTSGLSRTAGEVVRATSLFTIKTGLPGEEKIPGFSLATATTLGQVDELLGIIERGIDGAASIANNALMRVKMLGTPRNSSSIPLSFAGSAVVGDTVFLSDTGVPSLTPGSIRRQIGSVLAIPTVGQYNIWFNGVGGADITPIDPRYVVHGSGGILPNAVRVDGTNATGITGFPFRIKGGDAVTVPFQVQAFAGGTDIQQWLNATGSTTLIRVTNSGQLDIVAADTGTVPLRVQAFAAGQDIQRWVNAAGSVSLVKVSNTGQLKVTGGDAATILSQVQRFSSGGADLTQWLTETGTVLARVTSTGQLRVVAADVATVPLVVQGFLAGNDIQQWLHSSGTVIWRMDNIGDFVTQQAGAAVKWQTAGPVDVTFISRTSFQSTGNYDLQGRTALAGPGRILLGISPGGFDSGIQVSGASPPNNYMDIRVSDVFGSGQVHSIGPSDVSGKLTPGHFRIKAYDGTIVITPGNAGSLVDTWTFLKTGELSGTGGNRKIQNVLDPTAAQDAATKIYVDLLNDLQVPENFIINGAFSFWQRGLSSIGGGSVAVPGATRSYGPDRWAITVHADTGAGTVTSNADQFGSPSVELTNSRYYCHLKAIVTGPPTSWAIRLDQEIDRNFLEMMRGKFVTLQFKMKHTNIPGGQVSIQLFTGNGPENVNLEGGYSNIFGLVNTTIGATGTFNTFTFVSGAPVPTDAFQMGLRIQLYSGINGGAFNGSLDVGEVMLTTAQRAPTEFRYAGGSIAGELALCQRFYEKSYMIETKPGLAFLQNSVRCAVFRTSTGPNVFGLVPDINFNTRKRATPAIVIYSPVTGAAGNYVDITGADNATFSISSDTGDRMFRIVSLGVSTVGDRASFHWTADSEI